MIKKVHQKSLENYLIDLLTAKELNYSLWKATRRLKYPQTNETSIRNADGQWIRKVEYKAEEFAGYLEEIFQTKDITSNINVNILNMDSEPIRLFSSKEVAQVIDDLDVKRARAKLRKSQRKNRLDFQWHAERASHMKICCLTKTDLTAYEIVWETIFE